MSSAFSIPILERNWIRLSVIVPPYCAPGAGGNVGSEACLITPIDCSMKVIKSCTVDDDVMVNVFGARSRPPGPLEPVNVNSPS